MLLALVLDGEKRFADAERYYRRAATAAPNAPAVWNNFGNHWLARGNLAEARQAFERVLKLDANHANANLQLGRILVEQNGAAAVPLLERIHAGSSDDPAVLALFGRALAESGAFARAETVFANAVERAPAELALRTSLGLAALNAGHLERALSVFETARTQAPGNPDALYGLGRTLVETGDVDTALMVIADARRAAPNRTDIVALLARAASAAGFHADAAQAWADYLKLDSSSDMARRERGFSLIRSGGSKEGLPLLGSSSPRIRMTPRAISNSASVTVSTIRRRRPPNCREPSN